MTVSQASWAPARVEWCTRCGEQDEQLDIVAPRRPEHVGCGGRVKFRLLSHAERAQLARYDVRHVGPQPVRSHSRYDVVAPNHRRKVVVTDG